MQPENESETEYKTLELQLICPRCGEVFTWSGVDFESWVECKCCKYEDEAWFFWHSTNPPAVVEEGPAAKYEVWSYGAHYTNDAPLLSYEEFIEQLLWRYNGYVHGGGPYMWITRWWYQPDNPNNGQLKYKIIVDGYVFYEKYKITVNEYVFEVDERSAVYPLLHEVADKLVTGIRAIKSLPRSFFLFI